MVTSTYELFVLNHADLSVHFVQNSDLHAFVEYMKKQWQTWWDTEWCAGVLVMCDYELFLTDEIHDISASLRWSKNHPIYQEAHIIEYFLPPLIDICDPLRFRPDPVPESPTARLPLGQGKSIIQQIRTQNERGSTGVTYVIPEHKEVGPDDVDLKIIYVRFQTDAEFKDERRGAYS